MSFTRRWSGVRQRTSLDAWDLRTPKRTGGERWKVIYAVAGQVENTVHVEYVSKQTLLIERMDRQCAFMNPWMRRSLPTCVATRLQAILAEVQDVPTGALELLAAEGEVVCR